MVRAKIISNMEQLKFKPVTINLTFESKEELDWFGTIFNHSKIADLIKTSTKDWGSEITDCISAVGGDIHRTNELNDIFKY